MFGWTQTECLFYGGIIGMSGAAIGAVLAILFFAIRSKRLHARLEEEFGKKQQ